MRLQDEIDIIRTYLRDPAGRLWEDDLLIDLWNMVQDDLFSRTKPTETIRALPVPPRHQISHLYTWEREFISDTQVYQALLTQDTEYAATAPWEAQEYVSISGDAPAAGGQVTHSWEAWEGFVTDHLVWLPFPSDYHSAVAIYYDEEELDYCSLKTIQSDDPSWRTHRGEPWCYTRWDDLSNEFALFPRPETRGADDNDTTETAIALEGDTVADEYGTIVRRTNSSTLENLGIGVDIVEADDNILLWYKQQPEPVTSGFSEPSWPEYMWRYIRYGVLAQAYRTNNDAKIKSLIDYWHQRYELGIKTIRLYMSMRKADRDYRLTSKDLGRQRVVKHPRLPSTYPPL